MQTFESYQASYTGDGAAKTLTLGFDPIKIELYNITDGITSFKYNSMTTTSSAEVASDGTVSTPNEITFNGDGTVLIAAGSNVSAKVYHVFAIRKE